MTEKLYTLAEARLEIANEQLREKLAQLEEEISDYKVNVTDKVDIINKLNTWISELIKAGQNLRYQSGLPYENQYIQEWSDLVFRIKND